MFTKNLPHTQLGEDFVKEKSTNGPFTIFYLVTKKGKRSLNFVFSVYPPLFVFATLLSLMSLTGDMTEEDSK